MKLKILSDIHIRSTVPISRSDDYLEAQFIKLSQFIEYRGEDVTIIGGDLWDKSDMPSALVNRVITYLRRSKSPIYAIAGNHDLKYHNYGNLRDNSLWTLHESGCLRIEEGIKEIGDIYFHFNNFGCPVTLPLQGATNILISHSPIFEKEVPWFMSEAFTPSSLEKTFPGFNYYILGDVHLTTITDKVINTGSMMRSTKAQKEHRPCFVTVDTETGEKEITYFEIEQDVWKLDFEAPADESFSADLNELSEVLLARGEKLCYKDVAIELAKDNTKHQQRLMEIFDGYSERT